MAFSHHFLTDSSICTPSFEVNGEAQRLATRVSSLLSFFLVSLKERKKEEEHSVFDDGRHRATATHLRLQRIFIAVAVAVAVVV